MPAPLTDQAIAKIKELIISGELKAGSKLPIGEAGSTQLPPAMGREW